MDYLSVFSRTMSLRNILLYIVSSLIFSGCANAPLATSAPSLMPNTRGSRIAFIASPTDTKNLLEVYTIRVDGTDLQQLTKNVDGMSFYLPGDIKWSPDGNFIAFCLFPGGSYVMKADGSGLHLLDKVGCHPSWSPDGKTIALISKHDSHAQLYVVDLSNFNLRQSTQSENDVTKALWSPDGVHILFELFDHKIYVLDTTSLKETMLSSEGELSQWSPDGRLIAFVSSQNVKSSVNELFVMNADGTNLKQLTDNVPVSTPAKPETQSDLAAELQPTLASEKYKITAISWSPDNEHIGFITFKSLSGLTDAFVISKEGTGLTHVADDPSPIDSLSWSPDSRYFAFRQTHQGGIQIANSDGTNIHTIGNSSDRSPTNLAWSP